MVYLALDPQGPRILRHPKNPAAEIAALTLEGPFVRYAWERMLSLESLL